jgi:hypothetical protein
MTASLVQIGAVKCFGPEMDYYPCFPTLPSDLGEILYKKYARDAVNAFLSFMKIDW